MIKKLRFKFVLVNMGIVTVMLCIILGLVYHFTRANLESESIRMMESIAVQPFRLDTPGERGEEVRLPFFTIELDPMGELLSTGGGYYDLTDQRLLETLVETAASSSRRLGVIEPYNLRYYRLDTPGSRCLVFADISSERATLDGLMKSCLLIGGVGFLAFLWVSILLSKWAVRPVERAWGQQRQFVAAASHELKTPLTVIMTNAQLMQEPCYDGEKRAKFLDNILVMSRQMSTLIQQMLELARTDSAQPHAPLCTVDWSGVVTRAALPFASSFFEGGLTLTTQVEKGIQVKGEEETLRQVVEILLDNARKYVKPGGNTWVVLKRQGRGRCVLEVADEGEPIPEEELEEIFKRFYRADPARSRTGSFGLGLSIAQGIVQRHRGKIWAQSGGGVNTFYVELLCMDK